MPTSTYDIVILGAGSGGYACALRAAQLGLTVALVEEDKVGGTCLHRGCIPTKALLHTAEVADMARDSERYGVLASLEGVDMTKVNTYKDGVVARLYKGLQGLVRAADTVELVTGTGRLTAKDTVTVGDRELTGRTVVLATGSYAKTLPDVQIGGRIMTSDQALQLEEVPRHAIVLGGGVIGVEFASALRSFGAEVTVVEAMDRLVAMEDPAVSTTVERAYKKRGMKIRTGVKVTGTSQDDQGVRVELEGGDVLEGDLLLVAVGRGPRTEGMGYEEVGVELDRGFVTTDERLRTSVEGVRAVGDLVPGPQLAHRGFAHGIFVAEDLAGLEPAPVEDHLVPKVTYSDPEIASVGLSEQQARERWGEAVSTYEYNLGGNGKSQILGTAGFVKLVRSGPDGPVVGVHMVGARMGEQVGEAQLIVGWEALPEDVAQFLHAHPTQNEALGEAHLALAGKPLHAHG
ncbi:dihydrolipoyl dehydrogenase [uncultured Ornithinimicrobium sp.]|uniref:dihydrolipoyl dehydrogenase n=1 Tax=uncultured Ornithinimicrobium sp. TaxID=259307 RepID=UPI00259643D2|nr:dihydrolipoyl dehydrogenase [uncultured Ornithinimicrobium sp.]